jgi:hypothetical protein
LPSLEVVRGTTVANGGERVEGYSISSSSTSTITTSTPTYPPPHQRTHHHTNVLTTTPTYPPSHQHTHHHTNVPTITSCPSHPSHQLPRGSNLFQTLLTILPHHPLKTTSSSISVYGFTMPPSGLLPSSMVDSSSKIGGALLKGLSSLRCQGPRRMNI